MDMAEIMLEASKKRVEARFRTHPLAGIEICDGIQQVLGMYDFNLRSAAREDATLADQNHAERSKQEYAVVMAFLQTIWTTDAGLELADLLITREANRRGLAS